MDQTHPKNPTDQPSCHPLPAGEVVHLLGVDPARGLTASEVARRREKFGPNQPSIPPPTSPLQRLLLQFAQPLMYILLIAGVILLFLREPVDATVIFAVTIINALVGFFQELKAERAIDALSRMVSTEATVRRQEGVRRVSSVDLVPGDMVLLEAGDKVPADLRLLKLRGLQVDESMLTGESVPVKKELGEMAADTVVADRRNSAFTGTLVTHGQAEGVVWAIGNQTQTGLIGRLIDEAPDPVTPLTRKIAQFTRMALWAILALSVATFAIGLARGERGVDMFMVAVAVAVGAIPEGLPAALTITLAIGVSRMAGRGAIIRRLPAVEALGSTTVICSDKTGTLTENQMTVRQIYAGGKFYEVTGSGYHSEGEVLEEDGRASLDRRASLSEVLLAGVLNNDSRIVVEEGRLKIEGDPTEAALLVAAQRGGLSTAEARAAHPRIDVIPFESEQQFMATLHSRGGEMARVIYKKGSVERLLERCSHALTDNGTLAPLDSESVHAAAGEMAARGLRVLAFARREVARDHEKLEHDHVRAGLTFLGLQGMIDPPRPGAMASVQKCREAGIRVKMITGDHALTACSIARQLGLESRDGQLVTLTGRELQQIPDAELPPRAEEATVFARVAPEQKLRIVRALQSSGHIVAMTGDGVNDAPALKQADIGVAMGISGTDVAKGAADMLLTDDNFSSIEAAVEEGRGVFENLTKFLIWTLPTNVSEAAILLTAVVLGTALPVLPVQLLWVNMSTAILLGLMLVFEPVERDLMHRPPRDPRQALLTFPMIMRTGLVTLIMVAGAFGAFFWEQRFRDKTLIEARTTVITVVVVVECFYLLNCRSLLRSIFKVGFWGNLWVFAGIAAMVAAQVFFTQAPVMNRLFHTAPLDPGSWLYITGVGLAVYAVVEFEKWVRVRFAAKRPTGAPPSGKAA